MPITKGKKMKKLLTNLIVLGCLGLASCGTDGTNGTDGTDGKDAPINILDKAADFNKRNNSSSTTVAHTVVKAMTGIDNFVVFGNSSGDFYVYDLTNYDIKTGIRFEFVGTATVYSDNFYEITTHSSGYESYNGMILEETSSTTKDLESMGVNLESFANVELASNLEENYGLSAERAQSVAKITSSFQKIQNKRALTAKEMNIYTQKVLGVDYTAGKKALEAHIQGDSSEMDALIEKAAEMNNIDPEAVGEMVGEFLLK